MKIYQRPLLTSFTAIAVLAAVSTVRAQESTEIPPGDPTIPRFVEASCVEIYKDVDAWFGQNRVESVLQDEMGFVMGVDIGVRPTSELITGIPVDAEVVIITANSYGYSATRNNVNHPAAQANLRSFVESGGTLVMHLADNDYGGSFIAPGLSQAPDLPTGNDMNLVAPPGHPIVLGPDGLSGTADDLTQSNIQWVSSASAHHGVLPQLPQNATIFLTDRFGSPLWAEYSIGSGSVIVSALTFEFGNHGDSGVSPGSYYGFPRRAIVSEIGYAILSCLNTPPTADAGPDQTAECVDGQATVTLDGTGSFDPDGDALSFQWTAASGVVIDNPTAAQTTATFPEGITLATLTVTDDHGGIASDDVSITVEDTTPPAISCTTDSAALWPPNHDMVPVIVMIPVDDSCANPGDLQLLSVNISSNESDDADGTGDGQTAGDVHGEDGFTSPVNVVAEFTYDSSTAEFFGLVYLRAERNGSGTGRVYSIEASVKDPSGNKSSASCVVAVPKNQGKKK